MEIEIIKNVEEKLKNKNLNFTLNEEEILKNNPKLLLTLADIIDENLEIIEAKTISNIFDKLSEIDMDETEETNLYDEVTNKYNEIFLKYTFIKNKQVFKKEFILWDKTLLFIKAKIKDKTTKNLPGIQFTDELINLLLDEKRYDLINNENIYIRYITEQTFERIIKEYPFEKYNLNPLDIQITNNKEKILEENIDRLTPNIILNLTIKSKKIKEQEKQILLNKIKEEPIRNYKTIFENEYWNAFTLYEQQKIINHLIKTKNIDIILEENIELENEIIDEICKIIKDGYKIKKLENKYLLNNDKIIFSLIEQGYINYVSKREKYNKYKNYIINKIKENDEKYIEKLLMPTKTEEWIEIAKILIQNKRYNVIKKNDNLNYTGMNKLIKEENNLEKLLHESDELFETLITEYLPTTYHQKIYEMFIKEKNVEKLYYFLKLNPSPDEKFSKNIREELIDLIKNNIALSNLYLRKYTREMLEDKELKKIIINLSTTNLKKILSYIYHHETLEYLYDNDLYNETKRYFIKEYKLDPGHLETLKEIFGPLITKYIDINTIQNIINLDNNKFNKFINLFLEKDKNGTLKPHEFELTNLEPIYDSFKQEEFIKNNPETKNIFVNILKSLDNNNETYKKYINQLLTSWNENLNKKIKEKYSEEIINENYLEKILKNIKTTTGIEQDKYKEILHIITKHYIGQKREEYRTTYDMINELNIPYTFDEKDIIKEIIKYLLETNEEFKKNIIKELKKCDLDEKIINEIIDFYITKDKKKYEDKPIVKKHTLTLIKAGQTLLNESDIKKYKKEAIKNSQKLKKKYYLTKNTNIYEILSNIRINILDDYVLENDEIYNSLKTTMDKYKLDVLPKEINTLLKNKNYELSCETTDISTFISYYYKIYEIENKQLLTPINIFKYTDSFASVSTIYAQILGTEDENLIKNDPKPNNSCGVTKEERLKKSIEKTISNFKKQELKIPSFIKEIQLKNKQITAIVGNFTKPTNLTHGERTGSCMRIGGAGYKLYDSDEIFHIEFDCPTTGKYISRVTGFRNGNTVFLNELRNSCEKELFSDEEIIEATKKISEELINLTKTSPAPIENVVIHRAYAMEKSPDSRVELNVKNIKEGLPYFYTDITSYVQILASTKKDGEFTNVNLDNSKIPKYKPVREQIKNGNNLKIIEQINRIHGINQIIKTKDYKKVEPITNEIEYGIIGQDWYVFIDKSGKINGECIDIDTRAKEEYNKAQTLIKMYLFDKEKINGEKNRNSNRM